MLSCSSGEDTVLQDLATMGASQDVIDQYRAKAEAESVFFVLEENWDAVMLFNRSQSQWMFKPNGQLNGMNYSNVDITLSHMKTNDPDKVYEQFQEMEQAFLDVVNADN